MGDLSHNAESGTMAFDKQLVSDIILKRDNSVKSVLQQQKSLNTLVDNSNQTLLHISAKHGNAEITRYLIQCGCKIDAQDNSGVTPLMLAASEAKDVNTVDVLLKSNADIHVTDHIRKSSAFRKVIKMSVTWLGHLSAGCFQKTKYYRILKMFFARVEKEFQFDRELTAERLRAAHCPLALVMFMNNANITEYLLDMGYPLNELIRNWSTLHIAVLLADVANVALLLRYGAEVNDFDNQRQTPLFLYDKSVDNSMNQLKILKILCKHGASLNIPRSDGVTLIEYFFTNSKKNTLLALVESETEELKKLTPNGQTPLHFLAQNQNDGVDTVIELLLKSTNIDINARDSEEKTALVEAVNRGLINKIKVLSKFGAKVNLIDIFDKTNLFEKLTDTNGYLAFYAKIVELLVHRGNSSSEIKEPTTLDAFRVQKDKTFSLAKLMLKHLVLDEASVGSVNEAIFMKIEAKAELKEYYDLCKSQLQDMETTVVYGTVTLYKLLSESEEKLTLYARNPEFVEKFEEFMEDKSRDSFYYFDFLRKRIDYAIEMAVLRRKASEVICKICQLYPDPDHDVFYKISRYMANQDLHNLLKV